MGCDIHGWVEVKDGDKWIAIKELKSRDRNYRRFAALAGVRGEGGKAKGTPANVSETAKYDIEQWDSDGHSHSYMVLSEAARIFLDTAYEVSSFADVINQVEREAESGELIMDDGDSIKWSTTREPVEF